MKIGKRVVILGVIVLGAVFFLSCARDPVPTSVYWTGGVGSKSSNIVQRNYAYEKSDCGKTLTWKTKRDPKTTLSVLEFNEDGSLAEAKQLDAIKTAIGGGYDAAGKAKVMGKPDIVLIYAHGWQNSANPNLQCGESPKEIPKNPPKESPVDKVKDMAHFDTLLSSVSSLRGDDDRRAVFGVYVGWKGQSEYSQPYKLLSLDDRRPVARAIGNGQSLKGGNGLKYAVSEIVAATRRTNPKAKIIVIGHSLGGCMIERLAGQTLSDPSYVKADGTLDLEKLPDLYILMNNAEVAKESGPIMERINKNDAVRRAGESDRLISPWVVGMTSNWDTANSIANPINGLLGRRGLETTPGFTESMITHNRVWNTELVSSPRDEALDLANRAYLEPVFFVPFDTKKGRGFAQYRLVEKGRRSQHLGYWNFRIPAAVVKDHGDLYNVNALGAVTTVLQLAESRRFSPPNELATLPAGVGRDGNLNTMREEMLKYRQPTRLDQILTVQRETMMIRGERDIEFGDSSLQGVFTNFDRELLHGPALRLPYNENNVGVLLSALRNLKNEKDSEGRPMGGLHAAMPKDRKGAEERWPGDWRRRYAVRIFIILQGSHNEPNAWTAENKAALLSLLREDDQMWSCLESTSEGVAKEEFRVMVDRWMTEA